MGDVESIMRAGADVDHTQQLPMSQSLWCATHRSSLTASPISTLSTQASSMGLGCHGHPQIYQISIIATESSSIFSQKFALTPSPQQLYPKMCREHPTYPIISREKTSCLPSRTGSPDRAASFWASPWTVDWNHWSDTAPSSIAPQLPGQDSCWDVTPQPG
jgi:hypothetical protein